MHFDNPTQRRVFFEIHSGLPRESPGSDASTLRALSLVRELLPEAPLITDLGCGPGSSTIPLAKALPDARIIAVDLHGPFIEEVQRRAAQAGVAERVEARVADMSDYPLDGEVPELVWSEGSIYNLGVEAGLRLWGGRLKPGGLVVFNDAVWLVPPADRAAEALACWDEYPGMMDRDGVLETIDAAGFELIDAFDLPDSDWWAYFDPMQDKLRQLEQRFAGDADAAVPLREARHEIDVRARFPEQFGYCFFAVRAR